jgi:hypothetical protein
MQQSFKDTAIGSMELCGKGKPWGVLDAARELHGVI